MNKKLYAAFTMLELVMVIVVLGILAALAMPRIERDIEQEAADNILSAIRYTQHLALMDNVILPTQRRWQKSFWRIGFQGCSDNGIFYEIGSDKDMEGNIDAGEEAFDPANGLSMRGINTAPCASAPQTNRSPNIFITNKYGIADGNITYAGGCSNAAQHIAFDNLGRPHTGIAGATSVTVPDFATLLQSDCNLTFGFGNSGVQPFTITIERETGYASVVGKPNQ